MCGLWVAGLVWFGLKLKRVFDGFFFSFKKTFLFDKVSFMFMYYWYVFCFFFFCFLLFVFLSFIVITIIIIIIIIKKLIIIITVRKKKISCFNNKIITKCCLHFVTCFCSSPPLLFSVASTLNISLVISYIWYIHTQIYRCVYACVCQCVCVCELCINIYLIILVIII